MLIAIAACEIGFWVVLGLALLTRYGLRWRRVSTALLLAVPLVDVALLVFTVIDLRRGTTPTWTHSLAAVYLGFSVAFGHDLVRWADRKVAHRFAGAPPPPRPPEKGTVERARLEWRLWGKGVGGYVLTVALLLAMAALVGFGHGVGVLFTPLTGLGAGLTGWLIGWPLYYTEQARSRDQHNSPR